MGTESAPGGGAVDCYCTTIILGNTSIYASPWKNTLNSGLIITDSIMHTVSKHKVRPGVTPATTCSDPVASFTV